MAFTEAVGKNLLLKKDFVETNKVRLVSGKRNTKVGLRHWRKKPREVEEEMETAFGVPVQNRSVWG